MKIAFVYDVIYPFVKGGVEKRVHELAVRMAARGHDVHIVGMKYWEGPDEVVKDGVTLHGICPPQQLYTDGRRTAREALIFSARLLPFLVRNNFDIIDCQQFPYFPCFPVKFVSFLKKKPFVVTWHEVWGSYWYEYLGWTGVFGRITERIVAGLAPATVAVSKTTAGKLRYLTRRDTVIIGNGIDTSRIRAIPAGNVSSDIIFVGRLIREKHVDLLVRAFAAVLTESPERTLLILGDGPEREAIRSLIGTLGIGGRVRMLPFSDSHDEVIGLLKASHVCVIPSTREGFGIAALEALACGLPVITVDHPDNAILELITTETGFISTLTEDSLAASIREGLSRSPSMQPACTASAAPYDWDYIAELAEQHYHSLLR